MGRIEDRFNNNKKFEVFGEWNSLLLPFGLWSVMSFYIFELSWLYYIYIYYNKVGPLPVITGLK